MALVPTTWALVPTTWALVPDTWARSERSDGSLGGNTRARFHTALGSTREVRVGLQLALAWGYLEAPAVAPVDELLDRVCAMLFRLARGR